ncbi:MAG: hypothetical protein GXP63_00840 [DPANN group archaeon]|nr:hypothetical protein [DPANN group archaeon]
MSSKSNLELSWVGIFAIFAIFGIVYVVASSAVSSPSANLAGEAGRQRSGEACEQYTYSTCPDGCTKTCTSSNCPPGVYCTEDCDGPGSCLTPGRTVPPRREPVCGNHICEYGEAIECPVCNPGDPCDCREGSCPQDCQQPKRLREPVCGNNICEQGEASDCPVCIPGEPCSERPCKPGSCEQDCQPRRMR